MVAFTYAKVLELLQSGRADIESVGAFWSQATRARFAGVAAPLLSIPVTLHLTGEITAVVYAQLLTGPGLKEAYRQRAVLPIAWSGKRAIKATGKPGVASYAIPDFGLYWQATRADPSALKLGTEFATVLAEEFPDPEAELTRHFGADLETLAKLLQEVDYARAGSTLPGDGGNTNQDKS